MHLLLAGALPDPYDRALLVWTAPREVVEAFAEQDPRSSTGWSPAGASGTGTW